MKKSISTAASQVSNQVVQDPIRKHVKNFAIKSGWDSLTGEGAFEFVKRTSYAQGFKDGKESKQERQAPVGCVAKDGFTILYFQSELLPFETYLYASPVTIGRAESPVSSITDTSSQPQEVEEFTVHGCVRCGTTVCCDMRCKMCQPKVSV